MADYDRALQLDSTLAASWLNRGMLRYRAEQYAEAIADLRNAAGHGADAATVYYNLSLVHFARNDPTAARKDIERALEHGPTNEQAGHLRQMLERLGAGE
jgi:tetratricopeptide (TPR) repeat protein